MAFIEELGLERLLKPIDGLRDRVGFARAVKVVDRWGDDCFQCRYCQRQFYMKKRFRDHVRMCKSVHRGLQDKNRRSPKKMCRALEKLDAICEQSTHRNYLYSHQNQSRASGIGEFASNCTSLLGYGILGLLEGGLIHYKMDCMYSYFTYLYWNEEISRALLENPDCSFLSSINDVLLINKSRYDTSRLLEELGGVIWSCVLSDIVRIDRKLPYSYGPSWHFLNFNPEIFKQLLAISRSLALSNNVVPGTLAHNHDLTYDNLIIIPFLWDSTNTFGEEIATDFRQKLYNTQTRTFDFTKVAHFYDLVALVYKKENNALSYFFPANQKRDSTLDFGWQTYLRREIALQLFRKHIDRIYAAHSDLKPNFGIMSYISPYLITVDSGEEEIRIGIRNLTLKFLSVTKKHISDHGFQADVFKDIFEAVSILERFNCNTEVGDSNLSQWLTKDYPYFESITIPSTQKYWTVLQGFRKFSMNEAFSRTCRAILNNPLVLKHLAEWLGISSLETCWLAWEDLDPDNNWKNGFWRAPSPPKGVEIKYLEYCWYHRRWRIIKEKYRLGVELEKLYGLTQRLWKPCAVYRRWYSFDVDVLEPDGFCRCHGFEPIEDWRICLKWEEREVIIKEMIKENLRKTRPDIMGGECIPGPSRRNGSSIDRPDEDSITSEYNSDDTSSDDLYDDTPTEDDSDVASSEDDVDDASSTSGEVIYGYAV